MKKKFAILLALFLIAVVCSAGCIDPEDPVDPIDPVDPVDPVDPITPVDPVDPVVPTEEYSVMFMLNYGDAGAYTAETVKAGETVSKPASPTRSGYTFNGWFTAAEGGAAYDFTQPVNADVTLYAQWKKKSSSSSGGSSAPSHSHSYGDYSSNNDGTHSKSCASGDSTVTEACTFSGYTCTLCSYIDTVYHISNLSDLQNFANTVNNGESFSGKTVKLETDISLAGVTWTPIGTETNTFAGTFDGNDKTISNMAINGEERLGFFGVLYGTVKNLTVDGVTIAGNHYLGGIAGFGLSGLIIDCTVKNAEITATPNAVTGGYDNGDKVGGIVGYAYCDANNHDGLLTVSNCYVADSIITGFRDVGGIAGAAQGDAVTGNTVSNVTVVVDRATNYYSGYDTITGGEVLGRLLDSSALGINTATDSTVTVKYASGFEVTDDGENAPSVEISSAEGMIFAASSANPYGAWGAAGTGSQTYSLVGDIDMTGKPWNPVKIDGYHGADIFTLEGNGATITGLTTPLFAGGFAGGSGIIIKNLTIADSDIVSSNSDTGDGAFISSVDSMNTITLENCHLKDSKVTGAGRTGGLIGWTAGYNNVNDGPVKTYVNITNCSVINCTITAPNSVGGLYGHAGNNAWTYSKVENCVVKDNTLSSTNDGGWRVGVVVGTANVGELTISGITESGNTLTQTGKTAPVGQSNLYGRFVPGTTGKLVIDGVGILADGSKVIDGITYKSPVTVKADGGKTAQQVFNEVLADASSEANTVNTINLPGGEYTIDDAAKGKTLTIVGNGQDTVINSVDDGAAEGDCDYSFDGATVTFESVTITTKTTYFPGYARMKGTYNNCTINGVWTLYDNSTFNNCTFNIAGDLYNVWTWGATEATFNNCTFNSDGKALLLYGQVNTKLTLNDCTFNDKGGLSDLKAAIEIGNDYNKKYELIVNNCTVNGYEINDKGINTGTTLWGNKNSMGTDKLNVVVDGVDVY